MTKPTRLRFRHDKKARHAEVCRRALEKLDEYRFRVCLTWPDQIELFLDELRRQNASEHTVRNYASDLDQFLAYFAIPGKPKPTVEQIDALAIREWLGHLI